MSVYHSLKLAIVFLISIITLHCYYVIPVYALNFGVQANAGLSLSKQCSTTCESSFCNVPPFLRYGKYCGLMYGGCPGEKPCDGLDSCCMKHDSCIASKNYDYISQECTENLIKCMETFKKTGARTFKGNKCDTDQVINVITVVMDAALLAGRYLHKP